MAAPNSKGVFIVGELSSSRKHELTSRTFIHSHPCSNAFETSRVQLTPLRLCAIPSRRYSPRIVHSSIRLARGGLVAAVLLLAMAAPAAGIQSSGKLGAVDTCPVAHETSPK